MRRAGGRRRAPPNRAISVDAPVGVVYRWLCQLRAAPYSYDLLDNFGCRSPRSLTPGLERLAPEQRVMTLFTLTSFVRDEHLTISSGNRKQLLTLKALAERDGVRLTRNETRTGQRSQSARQLCLPFEGVN